jgi:hypothetical protein
MISVALAVAVLHGSADAAAQGRGPSGPVCRTAAGINAPHTKVPPLWMANGTEGSLTLDRLARIAAPILWFSPREFLILEDAGSQPSPTPLDEKAARGVVYYRIRQVRLKDPGSKRPPVLHTDSPVLRDVDQSVECPGGSKLPLDEIDRVTVRYFFYYPEDRGIGGHPHDVEGLELQIRIRPACWKDDCFYSGLLESVSGSAHGVGWYTSILDVFHAEDTELPLTVLVEENKHASSPDRDGDGVYMPHYDINVYSNDGWGVRDIAGTRPSSRESSGRYIRNAVSSRQATGRSVFSTPLTRTSTRSSSPRVRTRPIWRIYSDTICDALGRAAPVIRAPVGLIERRSPRPRSPPLRD